jgi:hypothetical protein
MCLLFFSSELYSQLSHNPLHSTAVTISGEELKFLFIKYHHYATWLISHNTETLSFDLVYRFFQFILFCQSKKPHFKTIQNHKEIVVYHHLASYSLSSSPQFEASAIGRQNAYDL